MEPPFKDGPRDEVSTAVTPWRRDQERRWGWGDDGPFGLHGGDTVETRPSNGPPGDPNPVPGLHGGDTLETRPKGRPLPHPRPGPSGGSPAVLPRRPFGAHT